MNSLISLDWSLRHLGKIPFESDSRDLKLSRYIDKQKLLSVERFPMAHDWTSIHSYDGKLPPNDRDPLANNKANCCVFAAAGHQVKMIGFQTGIPLPVTADMVLDAYGITGYKISNKLFDNGFSIRAMLKIWKLFGLYGTKALAYTTVNHRDPVEVALASWLGCGTLGGFALPKYSQGQVDGLGRQLWSVPSGGFPIGKGPGSWGHHAIWTCKPSPALDGGISWGEDTYWTRDWDYQCCDERWMVIVDKWNMATGRAPNGFAFNDLLSDSASRSLL